MFTVIETPAFQKQAAKVWTEAERLDFIAWIAGQPESGDVIPGADGAPPERWSRPGLGKRGGSTVNYLNLLADEVVL